MRLKVFSQFLDVFSMNMYELSFENSLDPGKDGIDLKRLCSAIASFERASERSKSKASWVDISRKTNSFWYRKCDSRNSQNPFVNVLIFWSPFHQFKVLILKFSCWWLAIASQTGQGWNGKWRSAQSSGYLRAWARGIGCISCISFQIWRGENQLHPGSRDSRSVIKAGSDMWSFPLSTSCNFSVRGFVIPSKPVHGCFEVGEGFVHMSHASVSTSMVCLFCLLVQRA